MIGIARMQKMIAERGPRYVCTATIRNGEYAVEYCTTAETAEAVRENMERLHHRQVEVIPPAGSQDLAALGRDRRDAKEALDEATAILRAAVVRALEEGRAEAEVARTAGIDRMTVRSWAGK